MIADVLSYLILIGGLVGISLGIYGLLRPTLARWRELFPSFQRHERDLRMVEEALSDIDYDSLDEEAESFRSFFGPADAAMPLADVRPAVPARPAVRTFKAPAQEAEESLPRVAALMPPLGSTAFDTGPEADLVDPALQDSEPLTAAEDVFEEEEDLFKEEAAAVLDDPLAEDDLDDLLSLFSETTEEHSVPEVIRNAVPVVSISSLLAEAREVQQLLLGAGKDTAA